MLPLLALLSEEDKVMKESDKVIELEREACKNREGGGYITLSWAWPLAPVLDADSSVDALHSSGRVIAPQLTFLKASKDSCWLV